MLGMAVTESYEINKLYKGQRALSPRGGRLVRSRPISLVYTLRIEAMPWPMYS